MYVVLKIVVPVGINLKSATEEEYRFQTCGKGEAPSLPPLPASAHITIFSRIVHFRRIRVVPLFVVRQNRFGRSADATNFESASVVFLQTETDANGSV